MTDDLSNTIRVLVLGKDARTDAIAAACAASPQGTQTFAYSEYNNPGLLRRCRGHLKLGPLTAVREIQDYAKSIGTDLAIIGPEEPLNAGVVDGLEDVGIPCFGPYKELAKIETSKAWARQLLATHHIPGNPEFRVFKSSDGLSDYLRKLGDFVVKPDGLTGGKGVRLSGEHLASISEAVDYANQLFATHGCVVIEEKLEGEEFSLQTITDGEALIHCPVVQDHKRAYEGDVGPNTGGMGSYSCADFSLPFLDMSDIEQAKAINAAVVKAIRETTGRPYRGVLYGGFIATASGVRLIEYNARFADPEGMNIIPLLQTDFVQLCYAVAKGHLRDINVAFQPRATVCKYVVPQGYPTEVVRNKPINIPPSLLVREDVRTFFAGVDQQDDTLYLTGSRGVAFVGIAETLEKAERLAEDAAGSVQGLVRHRTDIGTKRLLDTRIAHMARLRPRSTFGNSRMKDRRPRRTTSV
ncbi:MAG: phosphoribosylamine--glycine ligase [Phycisphaerae bacterium]|nr:phosphoribosylamine--glycine ligase [Phycisphaerae bacterium]